MSAIAPKLALAARQVQVDPLAVEPHRRRPADIGRDSSAGERAGPPGEIDAQAASRAQAADRSARPGTGQRRQQEYLPVAALHQHLHDRPCTADIPVDLEGWMRIEHIRIGEPGAQQKREDAVGMFAVPQTRPQVCAPRRRPTGRFIATQFERPLRGPCQRRRVIEIDLFARE
jgi:hypothetical protein